MLSPIPLDVQPRLQAGFTFLGREKRDVGKSGLFWFLVCRCGQHPEELLTQRQDSHLRGQNPCNVCADLNRPSQKDDDATVIQKCTQAHGGMFKYVQVVSSEKGRSKIKGICPEGHTFLVDVGNHIHRGVGCNICSRGKYTQETGEAAMREKYGDTLAPYAIRNEHRAYVDFVCKEHGPQTQILDRALRMKACPKCGRASATQANRQTRAQFMEKLQGSGSALRLVDGTFTFATEKAEFICENGHVTQKMPALIDYNPGCKMCSSRVSKPNREIADFLGGELEVSLGNRITVDVLLPSALLIVEYHGHIWHSDRYNVPNAKHYDRYKQITALGYRYIQIFQDEWEYRRPQCEALLRRAAKLDVSQSVGARQLEIAQLSASEAREFFSANHIQGAPVDTSKCFGLKQGTAILAAIAFSSMGSQRVALSEGEMELTRFATAGKVPGGFTRLLAHAKQVLGLRSIRTLSDNRLFTGDVYQLAGFVKESDVAPDYRYTDGTRRPRIHKSQMQKSRLALTHPHLDLSLPEQVLTRSIGYYRIYDAGKVLWRWRQA